MGRAARFPASTGLGIRTRTTEILALGQADCARTRFDQYVRDALTIDCAANVFTDIETAVAFLAQILRSDLILKPHPVDQTSALGLDIPLDTPEADSHPVVCVRVALRVDDGAVHRESPLPAEH